MKVSVIIPTKNRLNILKETLLFLSREQSYIKKEAEIIIVNDGDNIPESFLAKFPGIRTIKNKGSGAGNARNSGVSYTSGELLLFLDDDMLVSEDCIERHIALHRKYTRSLVSGTWEYSPFMKTESMRTPFGRYKIAHDYKPVQAKKENMLSSGTFYTDSLATFNLSVTRSDFLELGGFHIDFPFAGCEDQEFTMRAADKGFRLIIDNNIVCLHNEKDRLTVNDWLLRQFTGVQGFVLLCELFPFRKKERLYIENIPIQPHDNARLKLKKAIKFLFSRSWALIIIKIITRFLEIIHAGDTLLFRFYNALCGLYIYKGFNHAYLKSQGSETSASVQSEAVNSLRIDKN